MPKPKQEIKMNLTPITQKYFTSLAKLQSKPVYDRQITQIDELLAITSIDNKFYLVTQHA